MLPGVKRKILKWLFAVVTLIAHEKEGNRVTEGPVRGNRSLP